MKQLPFRLFLCILFGACLGLTSCQYPYGYENSGVFLPYRYTGRGPLGDLAASTLGSNRDHYYYVIRGSNAGTRFYTARPGYVCGRPFSYPVSYQRHPYYSNSIFSSPYYSRSPSSIYSYTNRPWGGGYGFGQPFSWGSGLGLGSCWF